MILYPAGGSRHKIAFGRSNAKDLHLGLSKCPGSFPGRPVGIIEMIHRVMDNRSCDNTSFGRCKGRYLILRLGVGYRERSWGEAESFGRMPNPLDVPSDTSCPDRHPAEHRSEG
jgi:hypothetical protein